MEQLERPPDDAGSDQVLRAKYADFCSAQLTEVFLGLSDERIYDLVEEAALDRDEHTGTLGFQAMVRLVTQKLRDSVPLPDFETWRDEYRANPERFDVHMLGLWEELLEERLSGTVGGSGETTERLDPESGREEAET